MNYQNWSTKKFWVVVVGIFLLGYLVAPKQVSNPKEITKEIVKEVPATCDYSDWKRLKEIDDTAINYSAEIMGLCSEGFIAVSNYDLNGITRVTNEVNAIVPKIDALAIERQSLLGKLGY